ncbi:hypothetical protein [Teichococcus oryzae]|uniref:DUF2939 domain-containing protein n=1 Tax=Teichococcus oryzae TaxID=1608942 RepID=A0A5B2TF67_9PROT|nr:hypothetical protein [Pseudoroseomonas oryzae]KAA2213121.1 hypothetical protein F0Q34_10815 [Pseudoroseomonas oryzae]
MAPNSPPADSWDEVWADYDQRAMLSRTSPGNAAPPPRRRRRMRLALLLGLAALGGAGLAGPSRPLLGMLHLAWRPEAMERLDWPASMPALPPARPRRQDGSAAPYLRQLDAMLAEGWNDPVALRRVVELRHALPMQRDPALRPPRTTWSWRRWGRAEMTLGAATAPELRLELGWVDGGWRVLRVLSESVRGGAPRGPG